MEDNKEAVLDSHGGDGDGEGGATAEEHVEAKPLKDAEGDNLIKHKDGELSVGSWSPNPEPLSVEEAGDDKCQQELKVGLPENGLSEEEEGRGKELVVMVEDPKEEEELNENGAITQATGNVNANGMEDPDTKPAAPSRSFLLDPDDVTGDEAGTEEDQAAFMKELETFHRERFLDFKPPKFYQEPLNCLKLWRAVIRLGGYEQVTSLKLWRQVGESFKPPKTCTTVSWTFRGFYEKALLEYEKYKMRCGELPFTDASVSDPAAGSQVDPIHASGSGRARRDAAARAMQGWHSQRLLGNGEVGDPIIKDKNPITTPKREKQLRNIGFLKRKGSSPVEQAVKIARVASKSQLRSLSLDPRVIYCATSIDQSLRLLVSGDKTDFHV